MSENLKKITIGETMVVIAKNKIQKSGGSFWIVIPGIWIEDKNLKKGDQLEIEINRAGNLVLKPLSERSKK